MKLDVKALALSGAILWGLAIFFITLWVMLLDGSTSDPNLIGKVYRGHSFTIPGAFIGPIRWSWQQVLIPLQY